jgi:hypothetical protein
MFIGVRLKIEIDRARKDSKNNISRILGGRLAGPYGRTCRQTDGPTVLSRLVVSLSLILLQLKQPLMYR